MDFEFGKAVTFLDETQGETQKIKSKATKDPREEGKGNMELKFILKKCLFIFLNHKIKNIYVFLYNQIFQFFFIYKKEG